MAIINRALWFCLLFCHSRTEAQPVKCNLDGKLIVITWDTSMSMGGFPEECFEENVSITLPSDAYTVGNGSQMDVEVAMYQTLKGISDIFRHKNKPAKWDPQKLDMLQNYLYRQVRDFGKCARRTLKWGRSTISKDHKRTALVNTYIEEMETLLKEKNYSSCAWEIIRKEVEFTLLNFSKRRDIFPRTRRMLFE